MNAGRWGRWGVLVLSAVAWGGCKSDPPTPPEPAAATADAGGQDKASLLASLKKECDAGTMTRCVEVGDYYLEWQSAPQEAMPYFKRACDVGLPQACQKLKALEEPPPEMVGGGAPGSDEGAMAGCQRGDARMCNDLGLFMVRGLNGFKIDKPRAREFFQKACDGGESEGCNNLGFMYESGDGVEEDAEKARDLYATSCDNGNISGCAKLGFLMDYGPYHVRDRDRARVVLEKACNGGSLEGCTNLGISLVIDAETRGQARPVFQKACDGGYLRACSKLGLMFLFGDGGDKDPKTAMDLFSKSCGGGNLEGCVGMGLIYRDGEGVEADSSKASQIFEDACVKGNKRACEELEKMR